MNAATAVINTLVDVRGLFFDQTLPKEKKLLEATRQTGDPYHFKCGRFIINASFDKKAPKLESNVKRLFT